MGRSAGSTEATGSIAAEGPSPQTLGAATDARAFLQQWLALAVARLPQASGALLLVEDEAGALVPGAAWPEQITDMAPYAQAAVLLEKEHRQVRHRREIRVKPTLAAVDRADVTEHLQQGPEAQADQAL